MYAWVVTATNGASGGSFSNAKLGGDQSRSASLREFAYRMVWRTVSVNEGGRKPCQRMCVKFPAREFAGGSYTATNGFTLSFAVSLHKGGPISSFFEFCHESEAHLCDPRQAMPTHSNRTATSSFQSSSAS